MNLDEEILKVLNETVEYTQGKPYYVNQSQDLEKAVEILNRMQENSDNLRNTIEAVVSSSEYSYIVKFDPKRTIPPTARLSYSKMYTKLRDAILKYADSTNSELQELVKLANELRILTDSNFKTKSNTWSYIDNSNTDIHGSGNIG